MVDVPALLRRSQPGQQSVILSKLLRQVDLLDHDEARLSGVREEGVLHLKPLGDLRLGGQQPFGLVLLRQGERPPHPAHQEQHRGHHHTRLQLQQKLGGCASVPAAV